MKILAISDIHGEKRFFKSAAGLMESVDIVAISGDITSTGKREEAEEIVSIIENYNKNILAVHGNWDKLEILDFFVEKGYNLHADGKIINNIGFFGTGGSNKTPMNTYTEYNEEDLFEFLESGYEKVKSAEKIVMVSHVPPKNTRDRTFLGLRGGSTIIREFCINNNVDLGIVGHIHEASGFVDLNSTVIVNPGPFRKGKCSVIDLNEEVLIKEIKLKK